MSEHKLRCRERLVLWLDKRDTVLIEAFLSLAALVVGWRVVDTFDGHPVAPLTGSALLQFSAGFWLLALGLNGAFGLLALTYGLWTGNTYRVRGITSFFGSIIWSAVVVAVLTQRGPLSLAAGYILAAVFSWIVFIILMVRADIRYKVVNRVPASADFQREQKCA